MSAITALNNRRNVSAGQYDSLEFLLQVGLSAKSHPEYILTLTAMTESRGQFTGQLLEKKPEEPSEQGDGVKSADFSLSEEKNTNWETGDESVVSDCLLSPWFLSGVLWGMCCLSHHHPRHTAAHNDTTVSRTTTSQSSRNTIISVHDDTVCRQTRALKMWRTSVRWSSKRLKVDWKRWWISCLTCQPQASSGAFKAWMFCWTLIFYKASRWPGRSNDTCQSRQSFALIAWSLTFTVTLLN